MVGNLLSDGARTFTYDGANRLTQVVSGTLTTQFTYNGDGGRVTKTVGGTQTRYTSPPSSSRLPPRARGGLRGGAWVWHLSDDTPRPPRLAGELVRLTPEVFTSAVAHTFSRIMLLFQVDCGTIPPAPDDTRTRRE